MKIKIKKLNPNVELPKIIDKGDWIDLRASKNMVFRAPTIVTDTNVVNFNHRLIPLGVAMELPKGCEAIIVPRSSTYKNWALMQTNSIGVIDHTYCGDNDEWSLPVIALKETKVKSGDRVCQFRIQLSQKATVWQKIKWLFSSRIKIEEVETLGNKDRNGFGSTGV